MTALLGAGGMGEVYHAHDPNLGRDVAIKVLPASVADDPHALARFEREARAVAALSHPNIRGIHDLVHQGALVFAVMELLEGETLRARLIGAPLPPKLALDWALQAARGLSAAHGKGIVHRDLKPENIFITNDGFVKILDFGLAKYQAPYRNDEEPSAPRTTVTAGDHGLETAEGVVVGTVDYMSPEQARGLPVDHRSDIFAFGSVLHEMLTGTRAFRRETAMDTMLAIVHDEPAVGAGAEPLPVGLDRIVRYCLGKEPENRFQSAEDLAYDLAHVMSGAGVERTGTAPASTREDRAGQAITSRVPPASSRRRPMILAGAALAIAAIAVVAALVFKQRSPSTSADGKKRIAVLPFENLGSADQDYFADGVADEVRGKLTSLPSLEVIARGSSTPFKKTTKTPQQIARELDVQYLLTGTIRWEKAGGGGRVQVTPELVELKERGAPASRWQQRFEAELTDVFKVQSDIATRVASELGVALGEAAEKHLAEKPTSSLPAYDAFLKGEEATGSLSLLDPASLKRGIEHYERAVALDPSFALAWAGLGGARSVLYSNATPTAELAKSAKEAAEKAVELAPGRSAGHVAMGTYQRAVAHDSLRALDSFERARRLEPSSAAALRESAVASIDLGRWDPAIEKLREAIGVDPLSMRSRRNLGSALARRRRLAEAREVYDRALVLAPTNLSLIEERAMVSLEEGDLAGARQVIRKAPREIDTKELVAFFASYYELGWVLEEQQRDLLLRLTPADFGDDKGTWASCLALEYALRGSAARSRELAGQAAEAFKSQLAGAPEDAQIHSLVGFALAQAGSKEDAIREGVRGMELDPIEKDAYNAPYSRQILARIYILTGEHEKALDMLEPLLKMPYFLTPPWLRIDPAFDPLRGNPRFQKLVAGG